MLQKQQEFLKRKEKLEQIYNGSAMSLVQFADKYYYKEDKQQAMNMVYEKLLEWPAGCVQELTPIDTQNFFVLCGMLAKYETRPKTRTIGYGEKHDRRRCSSMTNTMKHLSLLGRHGN